MKTELITVSTRKRMFKKQSMYHNPYKRESETERINKRIITENYFKLNSQKKTKYLLKNKGRILQKWLGFQYFY